MKRKKRMRKKRKERKEYERRKREKEWKLQDGMCERKVGNVGRRKQKGKVL